MKRWTIRAGLLLFSCGLLWGSQADVPKASLKFDVASVKIGNPNDLMNKLMEFRNGRFVANNRTLKEMIMSTYRVQADQISGGPGWIDSDLFIVEAKSDANPTSVQAREMVQTLLADRFQLQIHTQKKEFPVYALVVDKDGPKLGPAMETDASSVNRRSNGYLRAEQQTVGGLATFLSSVVGLGRPVVDETGITGKYTFTLRWLPAPGELCPSCNAKVDEDLPNLFTAIQEQLGLKLESKKVSLDTLVIDHVAKPSMN